MFSGCTPNFSVETLLTPPKMSEEQTAIYNALTAAAGRVELRYPRTGDYLSAFVIHQLDEEPGQEAIVFYESRSAVADEQQTNASWLKIGFLDCEDDGSWRLNYELPVDGVEVDSVNFSTLGWHKTKILVSMSVLNSSSKSLCVIDYANGKANMLDVISYSEYTLGKVTSEHDELLVFSRSDETAKATMSVYSCVEGGEFKQRYNTVNLDKNISEYDKIVIGNCTRMDNSTPCVAVDYLLPDNQYGTDVIYFNGKALVTADDFVREGRTVTYTRKANNLSPKVNTTDIDGDGILDVPISVAMPRYESLTVPEQLLAYSWYSQSSDGATQVAYTFIDPGNNFVLVFPGRWVGMVTATVNTAAGSVTFWEVPADAKSELKKELLSVKLIKTGSATYEQDCEDALKNGYTAFSVQEDKLIYVKNTKYEDLSLTEDELTAFLRALDNEAR